MIMALEQPAIIDLILVVQILSNLQFSTKVLKFGILSKYQLPVFQSFLALRKNVRVFTKTILNWPSRACAAPICKRCEHSRRPLL